MMGSNGIFIKIDGYVFQTQSIFCDDNGVFVFNLKTWKCPECDREYPQYEKECPWHPKKKSDVK